MRKEGREGEREGGREAGREGRRVEQERNKHILCQEITFYYNILYSIKTHQHECTKVQNPL